MWHSHLMKYYTAGKRDKRCVCVFLMQKHLFVCTTTRNRILYQKEAVFSQMENMILKKPAL